MATILQKFRTVLLSSAHALLDAAIDLNSVAAIKQHVRDLEGARDKIADEAAIADGRAAALKSDIIDLQGQKGTTGADIDSLLGNNNPSDDHHAMPLAERMIQFGEDIEAKQAELVEQKKLAAELEEAHAKISAQHGEMLRSLNRLESMERATAARNQAAEALKGVAKVTGAASAASVDNVTSRLRDQDAVAKARFDRALAGVGENGPADAVRASQAAALIAASRAKIEQAANRAKKKAS